jgi:hypothetical protein
MTTTPLFVNERNLSIAWARAFEAVLARGVRGLAPLIVNITGLDEKEIEVPAIRALVDEALRRQGHADCHTVANTIFPEQVWKRSSSRQTLYDRYLKMLPKIRRRDPGNRYGTYFERMIRFGKVAPYINQLEHLFGIWDTVKRPTAYQLNIFDPARDHTRQPLRGFPCLQHVSFTPLGLGKMSVLATYPAQYLFERAYGNYLGLYRLGKFVAGELKLDLTQLTCVVGLGLPGDESKRVLRGLAEIVRPHMCLAGPQQVAGATAERADG